MSSSVTCRPIACQKHLILFRSLMRIAFHMAILLASVTSESLLTDVDCQVTGGSTTYQACMSSPEHLVQSQAASCYVNVSPDGSTCGLTRQRYCTLGLLQKCSFCDNANTSTSHPPSHMIDYSISATSSDAADAVADLSTWWQSVTWYQLGRRPVVDVTISFGKLYQFLDDLIIVFQSGRPKQMVLEKSVDFGRSWSALQYFNRTCKSLYDSAVALQSLTVDSPDGVTCTTSYSSDTPYTGGQVVFSVTNDRYRLFLGDSLTNFAALYEAFDNTNLTDFLLFTDIRLRLIYPATDGDELVSSFSSDFVKYYYAIADIDIVAGCWCNLHGKTCTQVDNRTVCKCFHNTDGDSCERCLPLYNERPWMRGSFLPYPAGTANECRKCECHGHSSSCWYNASLGHGQCDSCQHNTTGPRCDTCQTSFYRNSSASLDDVDVCIPCDCERLGVVNINVPCDAFSGQCLCKQNVTGLRCDACANHFYGLFLPDNPGVCKECACNVAGTVLGASLCDVTNGQCRCKPNVELRDCSRCKDGYFAFPSSTRSTQDCTECQCDPGGSVSLSCDKESGQCPCRPNLSGRRCDVPSPEWFIPALNANLVEPSAGCPESTVETGLLTCQQGDVVLFANIADGIMQSNLTGYRICHAYYAS